MSERETVQLGEFVPAPTVAKEFGITRRTLGRWIVDSTMNFPRAIILNNRLYFSRAELEKWKIARVRAPISEAF